jgi:hypothetical protein
MRPTSRQLAYLKALAQQTATSFAYPRDRSDASREIVRLRQLAPPTGGERGDAQRADDSGGEVYGTAPASGEIAGYGSTATWNSDGYPR